MGADKFKTALKIGQGGVSVDMPADEAAKTVSLYRAKYDRIAALWKAADKALEAMVNGFEAEFGQGITLRCTPARDEMGIDAAIALPNGTHIRYPGLRKTKEGFEYDNRYGAVKIYGAKVVENVVQALARIVVFDQMARIDQMMRPLDTPERRHKVVLTVHDEIVVVVPEDKGQEVLTTVLQEMSKPLKWCLDLPIACEGDIALTYGDAE